jgi:hypothetical protein
LNSWPIVDVEDVALGDVELGALEDAPLLDVAPRPLVFFSTKPLLAPALLPVACCTQPVIVTGDPYVLVA